MTGIRPRFVSKLEDAGLTFDADFFQEESFGRPLMARR
jgi:hypothetical protein